MLTSFNPSAIQRQLRKKFIFATANCASSGSTEPAKVLPDFSPSEGSFREIKVPIISNFLRYISNSQHLIMTGDDRQE